MADTLQLLAVNKPSTPYTVQALSDLWLQNMLSFQSSVIDGPQLAYKHTYSSESTPCTFSESPALRGGNPWMKDQGESSNSPYSS